MFEKEDVDQLEEDFISLEIWPAENLAEFIWLIVFRSSQWLPLSAMSAYSWERVKYNQQQRQIKLSPLCKSKSTHWLHTVKKCRNEMLGSDWNTKMSLITEA